MAQGIDQYSITATLASKIRWIFNIGTKFEILRISQPLAGAVATNTTITPKVYFDEESIIKTLTTINNTNYPSKRKIIYKGTELKDYFGQNNFIYELAQTGTNPLVPSLPIIITVDLKADEPTA